MNVQRDRRQLAQLPAEIRAQRIVRHEFSIHDIDMQGVDAALFENLQRLRHAGKNPKSVSRFVRYGSNQIRRRRND